MELTKLLQSRRSCRHYKNTPITDEIIAELIDAASLSPSSCNLQLTQYVVINDKKILDILSEKVSKKFKYAPCNIMVLHDSRFSVERSSGIMTAGMAVENILLKATSLGLATCAMAGFSNDKKIKEILKIPSHIEILLNISVGYSDENFIKEKIPKISLNDRYNYNSYGNLKIINDSKHLSRQSISDIINYRRRIAPVYLDRFRLNSYSNSYYKDVFNLINEEILSKKETKNILDLMSYDGIFLKLLFENTPLEKTSITTSDYLQNNLDFFSNRFKFKKLIINENNKIKHETNYFDLVTFIFQMEFTPKISTLLKNVRELIKSNGLIVVSVVRESLSRKTAKKIKYYYKKFILQKNFNIYENNTFYKIGPIDQYSKNKLLKLYKKIGFNIEKYISLKEPRGIYVDVYIFKKIS